MNIRNIGVMSPGDMGQAVAYQLKQGGFAVHTALDGRSARSKTLAAEAGLIDVGSIDKLVERTKQHGMSALALTDHDDVGGAVRFATAARTAGLAGILATGCAPAFAQAQQAPAQNAAPKPFAAGTPLSQANEKGTVVPMSSNVKVFGSFNFAESCTFDPARNLILDRRMEIVAQRMEYRKFELEHTDLLQQIVEMRLAL